MQIIYTNENKGSNCGGTDSVDIIIYRERVGGHLEGKYAGGLEERIIRIQNS